MTVEFRTSFVGDLESLDPRYRARIEAIIVELEAASTLRDVRQLKKLQGRSGFFRIRVGRYRLGLVGGQVTLVRWLDRKEFYRHFS